MGIISPARPLNGVALSGMDDFPFNSKPHLDRLLERRDHLIAAARELRTPNTEDDELIRCGIVGFAQHVPLDRWDADCFQYLSALRDEVLGDAFSADWRHFTCLAGGYFLGMRVAGVLNDPGLRMTEAHTPGYMWAHSESFDSTATGDDRHAG